MERAKWRADLAYPLLQIRQSPYYGRMCMAQEFVVTKSITMARSTANANPQFGEGGGERIFIPTALHRGCVMPIGDVIILEDTKIKAEPSPVGLVSEVIAKEAESGNLVVVSDCASDGKRVERYWLNDCLKNSVDIELLDQHDEVEWYADPDIHGNACGITDRKNRQILVAAVTTEEKRTWTSRLWSSITHR